MTAVRRALADAGEAPRREVAGDVGRGCGSLYGDLPILRTGLPAPLLVSSQLVTGRQNKSARISGLERCDLAHGFRPGRRQHDTLDALIVGIPGLAFSFFRNLASG